MISSATTKRKEKERPFMGKCNLMHGLHILKNFILTITLWEWVSYLSFIDKKIEVEKSNLSKVTVSGK